MDARTAELIALRKAAVEQVAASPSTARGVALQHALGPWAAPAAEGAPLSTRNSYSAPSSPAVSR